MRKEKNTASDNLCYVCEKPIGKGLYRYIGNGLFRHEVCCPGTVRWLKSKVGQHSALRELFEKTENRFEVRTE